MRDFGAFIKLLPSIAVVAKGANATVNGTGVDLASYDGAVVEFIVGIWTDGTHALKVQESTDNSAFTDVAAADLILAYTSVTANGSPNSRQKATYIGKQRYIRPVVTSSGVTTGAVIGADVICGFPRKLPLS